MALHQTVHGETFLTPENERKAKILTTAAFHLTVNIKESLYLLPSLSLLPLSILFSLNLLAFKLQNPSILTLARKRRFYSLARPTFTSFTSHFSRQYLGEAAGSTVLAPRGEISELDVQQFD